MKHTELIVAESAGFCYGVERAVKIAEDAAARGGVVFSWGPLIHNGSVQKRLAEQGVVIATSVDELVPNSSVILRSHGVGPDVLTALGNKNVTVVDATCPYVTRIHELVRLQEQRGRRVIIIGDRDHPEVVGIAGWCREPLIFPDVSELSGYMETHPAERNSALLMVAQTTAMGAVWEKCVDWTKKECTNIQIVDTICKVTDTRQREAAELAQRCDAVVVVGDRTSSNARKLFEVCSRQHAEVLMLSCAVDWPKGWLRKRKSVGLTAGASTPPWIIEEVIRTMSEELNQLAAAEEEAVNAVGTASASEDEESFEALLEQSFKTLNTGDKVKGVITAITPTEVYVELGTKHAGYIPIAELTDDPDAKIEDLVRVGDEIETYAVRVNDVEGTVTLSKKRMDTVKTWEDVESAQDTHVIMSGIVTEENKGGVVVSVKGVRVFVPASQTGLPRETPMSTLLKKRVSLKIMEVNRARRRVVGSINAATQEERRTKSEEVWNNIEVGKTYKGTVKSLTSYGAFVDIGGVDGMVHVSELSWSRLGHPSELVQIGDEISVYVLSFDPEKKKISLGHKDPNQNPWKQFIDTCQVGDVVNVKVVKFMPFGAFAEVIPGVDGLIHIGQISDTRIDKPGDVLTEGQKVDVKITAIDMENKKISLSIRALIEQPAVADEAYDPSLADEVVATSGDNGADAIEIVPDEALTTGDEQV